MQTRDHARCGEGATCHPDLWWSNQTARNASCPIFPTSSLVSVGRGVASPACVAVSVDGIDLSGDRTSRIFIYVEPGVLSEAGGVPSDTARLAGKNTAIFQSSSSLFLFCYPPPCQCFPLNPLPAPVAVGCGLLARRKF
ncbi:hypothetical protein E2C01_044237 [Portunus trituberculatus]|uniref:Uncharacterized protein n=1 Tax=Portunus trituberculatus TaxID=210409 RepID=A0A5B7FYS4_PORTR|nr:hypothetical protein [Portunus trituberculatus]